MADGTSLTEEDILRFAEEQRRAEEAERIRRQRLLLATSSPEAFAQYAKIARETGLPPAQVEVAPDAAKARQALQEYEQTSPDTRAWLDDPVNMGMAKDNLPTLTQIEQGLKGLVGSYGALGPAVQYLGSTASELFWRDTAKTGMPAGVRTGIRGAIGIAKGPMDLAREFGELGSILPDRLAQSFGYKDSVELNKKIGISHDVSVLDYLANPASFFSDVIAGDVGRLAGSVFPQSIARTGRVSSEYLASVQEGFTNPGEADARNIIEKGAYAALESFVANLPGLLGGAAVGTGVKATLVGVTPAVVMTKGEAYAEARKEGLDPVSASLYSSGQGGIEGLSEFLPTKFFLDAVKVGSPFVRKITEQIITDIGGEQVATHASDALEWIALHPEKTLSEFIAERPSAAAQTFWASVFGSALNTTLAATLSLPARMELARQQTAQKAYIDQLTALNKTASASKLLARDKDTFEDYVRTISQDAKVYVDRQTLEQQMAQNPELMEAFAQNTLLSEAMREPDADSVVALPLAAVLSTPSIQTLKEDIRPSPTGLSLKEARQEVETFAQTAEETFAKETTRVTRSREEKTYLSELRQRYAKEMHAAGMGDLGGSYVRAASAALVNMYATMSGRMGITVPELFKRIPALEKLSIRGYANQPEAAPGRQTFTADVRAAISRAEADALFTLAGQEQLSYFESARKAQDPISKAALVRLARREATEEQTSALDEMEAGLEVDEAAVTQRMAELAERKTPEEIFEEGMDALDEVMGPGTLEQQVGVVGMLNIAAADERALPGKIQRRRERMKVPVSKVRANLYAAMRWKKTHPNATNEYLLKTFGWALRPAALGPDGQPVGDGDWVTFADPAGFKVLGDPPKAGNYTFQALFEHDQVFEAYAQLKTARIVVLRGAERPETFWGWGAETPVGGPGRKLFTAQGKQREVPYAIITLPDDADALTYERQLRIALHQAIAAYEGWSIRPPTDAINYDAPGFVEVYATQLEYFTRAMKELDPDFIPATQIAEAAENAAKLSIAARYSTELTLDAPAVVNEEFERLVAENVEKWRPFWKAGADAELIKFVKARVYAILANRNASLVYASAAVQQDMAEALGVAERLQVPPAAPEGDTVWYSIPPDPAFANLREDDDITFANLLLSERSAWAAYYERPTLDNLTRARRLTRLRAVVENRDAQYEASNRIQQLLIDNGLTELVTATSYQMRALRREVETTLAEANDFVAALFGAVSERAGVAARRAAAGVAEAGVGMAAGALEAGYEIRQAAGVAGRAAAEAAELVKNVLDKFLLRPILETNASINAEGKRTLGRQQLLADAQRRLGELEDEFEYRELEADERLELEFLRNYSDDATHLALFYDVLIVDTLGQEERKPLTPAQRLKDRGPVREVRGNTYMGVAAKYTVPNKSEDAPVPRRGGGLILASTNERNADAQSDALDALLKKHKNPFSSLRAWVKYANDAFSIVRVPMPPWRTMKIVKEGVDLVAQEIGALSPGMVRDAEEGLATAARFGNLYSAKRVPVSITAKAFLWSFLSRGVSPYVQEGAFLDAVTSAEATQIIEAAVANGWSPELETRWDAWATAAIPPGSPGRGTQHNLNAFGRNFLRVMTQRHEDAGGRTGLQIIHDMISDGTPSYLIRREFLKRGVGAGIDNKVVSFTLLLLGRTDVIVLDRVQVRNQFDDGRFAGENIYDAELDADGNEITGTAFAEITFGHKGLFYYEAMERALKPIVEEAYSKLGRAGSLGRYHWDSWLLASDQEVGHASVEGLLAEAEGKPNPYGGTFVRQGKYFQYDYGFRYGVMSDGSRLAIIQGLADGRTYIVQPADIADTEGVLRKTLAKLADKAKKRAKGDASTKPWTQYLTEAEKAQYDEAIASRGTVAADVWADDPNAVGRTGAAAIGEAAVQDGEQAAGRTLGQEQVGGQPPQPVEGAPAEPERKTFDFAAALEKYRAEIQEATREEQVLLDDELIAASLELSDQQLEIFRLARRGMDNSAIADAVSMRNIDLGRAPISNNQVSVQLNEIRRKGFDPGKKIKPGNLTQRRVRLRILELAATGLKPRQIANRLGWGEDEAKVQQVRVKLAQIKAKYRETLAADANELADFAAGYDDDALDLYATQGLAPALMDPETGEIYASIGHADAVALAPPDVRARLQRAYDNEGRGSPNVGFVIKTLQGPQFFSRAAGMREIQTRLMNDRFKKKGSLAQAQRAGYTGANPTEAAEWLAAVAKGLDMSTEARMQRARAMGFDVNWILYHGTRAGFSAFERGDLGYHFGSVEQANRRLFQTRRDRGLEGENVLPVYLRITKSLDLPDVGDWDDPVTVARELRFTGWGKTKESELDAILAEAEDLLSQFADMDAWRQSPEAADLLAEIRGLIQADGYDSVRYVNIVENAGGLTAEGQQRLTALNNEYSALKTAVDARLPEIPDVSEMEPDAAREAMAAWAAAPQPKPRPEEARRLAELRAEMATVAETMTESPYSFIVFDPANIRSVHAAFDPDQAGSADLLAQAQRIDVTARTPELQAAAQQLRDGLITADEYAALVAQYKPVTPYAEVPMPATEEDLQRGLTADKTSRIGVPSSTLAEGHPVGLRLDIPAYSNHGVWVVSVHEQGAGFAAGKSIGYESVAAATNVTFGAVEKAALGIAAGKPKATIAVMKGGWKPTTPEQAKAAADAALTDPAWVQVGMDPERHSYFYDRSTMQPVVAADEVIQVGPLVLAKNPQYGQPQGFLFQEVQLYSPLVRAIENSRQNAAPPAQWLAMLYDKDRNASKIPGVKLAELQWSGVLDWLGSEQDAGAKSITKAELADFLSTTVPRVVPVVRRNVVTLQDRYDKLSDAFFLLRDAVDTLFQETDDKDLEDLSGSFSLSADRIRAGFRETRDPIINGDIPKVKDLKNKMLGDLDELTRLLNNNERLLLDKASSRTANQVIKNTLEFKSAALDYLANIENEVAAKAELNPVEADLGRELRKIASEEYAAARAVDAEFEEATKGPKAAFDAAMKLLQEERDKKHEELNRILNEFDFYGKLERINLEYEREFARLSEIDPDTYQEGVARAEAISAARKKRNEKIDKVRAQKNDLAYARNYDKITQEYTEASVRIAEKFAQDTAEEAQKRNAKKAAVVDTFRRAKEKAEAEAAQARAAVRAKYNISLPLLFPDQYKWPGGRDQVEIIATMPGQIQPWKADNLHFPEDGTTLGWVRGHTYDSAEGSTFLMDEIQTKRFVDEDAPTDAPYTGDGWSRLAIKLALKHAVESGATFIALQRGGVVAQRWRMSNFVRKITYDPATEILTSTALDGREQTTAVPPADLHRYVGVDRAKTLLATGKEASIEGKNIDIGMNAEKRRRQYDVIFKNNLAEAVKPFGGKLEEGELPDGSPVTRVRITPEMAAQVEEKGLSLFQPRRGEYLPITNPAPYIMMHKSMNFSTFLHEMGHLQLDIMMQLAAMPDAPADIKQDAETVLAWFRASAPRTYRAPLATSFDQSLRRAAERSAEERSRWFDETVRMSMDFFGTQLEFRDFPDLRVMLEPQPDGLVEAAFTYDDAFRRPANTKATVDEIDTATQIMARALPAIQEWVVREQPDYLSFSGASPAHSKVYALMLGMWRTDEYTFYRSPQPDGQDKFLLVKNGARPISLDGFQPLPARGRPAAGGPLAAGPGAAPGPSGRPLQQAVQPGPGAPPPRPDLPAAWRQAIYYASYGYTPAEVAAEVEGVSASSLRSIYSQRRSQLRGLLASMDMPAAAEVMGLPLPQAEWLASGTVVTLAATEAPPEGAPAEEPPGEPEMRIPESVEDWLSFTLQEQVYFHELFARGFEAYLLEGRAPSPQMKGLFAQFATWLGKVYVDIASGQRQASDPRGFSRGAQETGGLAVQLSDDVRGVMDRLVASSDQIERAQRAAAFRPVFASRDQAGMTPAEWEDYERLLDEAKDEAAIALQKRSVGDMRWINRLRDQIRGQRTKANAAMRKEMRKAVAEELAQQPLYRAHAYLSRGIGAAEGVSHKLNRAAMVERYGKALVDRLATGPYGVVSKTGGMRVEDLDALADMYGYPSGEALLNDLAGMVPLEDAIEAETDARLIEQHGDLSSPEAVETAVAEAMHGRVRMRILATELNALLKMLGRPGLLLEAVRASAQQKIASLKVRDLKPARFMMAAESAARAADAGLRKIPREGKKLKVDNETSIARLDEVVRHKRAHLLNARTAREAVKAAAEIDKMRRLFDRVLKGSNEDVAKRRDINLVLAARALLAAYGQAPAARGKKATEYLALVQAYNPEVFAELNSLVAEALLAAPANPADITVQQLRDLHELVDQIYTRARNEKVVEIMGRQVEVKTAAEELISQLDELKQPKAREAGVRRPVTEKDREIRKAFTFRATLRRVESWARKLDLGKIDGPWQTYIFRPMSDAAVAYKNDIEQRVRSLVDILAPLSSDLLRGGKIDAPELDFAFNNKSELLHFLLHLGNPSNRKKLLLGYRKSSGETWGIEQEDGSVTSPSLDAFLDRMHRTGVLTKKHWDTVQNIWDLMEAMKPGAQKAHKAVYGTYFSEITAAPVQTPFGTYRGGYVPAITEALVVLDKAQAREAENILADNYQTMFPTPAAGFTKGRVEDYTKPLVLDIASLISHVDTVAKFTHLAPAARQTARIIQNADVTAALNAYDPTAINEILIPFMVRTARQLNEILPSSGTERFFAPLLALVRRRTSMVIMFANVVNTLQQVTGLIVAGTRVNPARILTAGFRYMANSRGYSFDVMDASPFMRTRMRSQVYEMITQVQAISALPNRAEAMAQFFDRHTYFMQQGFQNVLDMWVWRAAYEEAIDKGADHDVAVRNADGIIRTTMGSTAPEDVSASEVVGPFGKLFGHMTGYFNGQLNALATEMSVVWEQHGWRGAPQLGYIYFIGAFMPIFLANALALVLRGQWEPTDEEEESPWLWFYNRVILPQIKFVLAGLPVLGPAINTGINQLNDLPYDDRISTPVFGTVERALGGVADITKAVFDEDEITRQDVGDISSLISLLTGIPLAPVSRPVGYQVGVEQGDIEPTSDLDYARGLVTGVPSEASR